MDELYSLGALAEPLCSWYRENRRSMPWREDPSPYHVWISEIMLQQTRIEAVKEYYDRFIRRLPDVESLACISEEELMKLWQGLGYYNRARNLKKAAQRIVERHDGVIPDDYEKLMELPGIGSYTAGAISSIAYGLQAPAVDGNVLRVVMRILNCDDDVMRAAVRRKTERSIMAVIPFENPGEFNQALMELGETVCIPNGTPDCYNCPLNEICSGFLAGCVMNLPVRTIKKKRRVADRTVLMFVRGKRIAVCKRPEKGLLAGMWEFPSLDGSMGIPGLKSWLDSQNITHGDIRSMGRAKHIFSHVEWNMKGYVISLESDVSEESIKRVAWADREELINRYAIPTAYRFYLEKILDELL